MNDNQMQALLEACKNKDEVKIITCALSIAASAAREKKQDVANSIRHLVDRYQGREGAEKAYREQRREIATQILSGLVGRSVVEIASDCNRQTIVRYAIDLADELIVKNANSPIPK